MTQEDYWQIESSQRQHNEMLRHSVQMEAICSEADFAIVASLKPRVFIDGDKWCVLYGDNLQDGIAGFGSTPLEAVRDFNASWQR